MRKFFKGLLAFILIAIIISGIGYIGYSNYFFRYNSTNLNMSMSPSAADATNSMQHGTMTTQNSNTNSLLASTVEDILSNKQNLENAISAFNRSLDSLTLDPYSPESNDNHADMNGMQMPPSSATTEPISTIDTNNPIDSATENLGSNTTINIYPTNANGTQGVANTTMSNMGTTYDVYKMEQLHKGLYKLSMGIHKLEKLNESLIEQAEAIKAYNMQDQAKFFENQYTQILQNKSKLRGALNDIKSASNLVNINPYISDNGVIYDKDRMLSIHESIFTMAEGIALLEQLNEELLQQAIDTSINVQNAINNANMLAMESHVQQTTGTMSTPYSLDFSSTLKLALAASMVLFVLGLIGAIRSLFKTPKQSVNQ